MYRLILQENMARGATSMVSFFWVQAIPSLAYLEDYHRWQDFRSVQFIGKSAHACIIRFPYVVLSPLQS